MKVVDLRAHDGSRQFLALPATRGPRALRDHLAKLPGARIGGVVSDGITESWIDFEFGDHAFTVNEQFGEYWFFVRDPGCPPAVLAAVAAHCAGWLGE
jgi:hypothetical protein